MKTFIFIVKHVAKFEETQKSSTCEISFNPPLPLTDLQEVFLNYISHILLFGLVGK